LFESVFGRPLAAFADTKYRKQLGRVRHEPGPAISPVEAHLFWAVEGTGASAEVSPNSLVMKDEHM
jgi:hypothetical protein